MKERFDLKCSGEPASAAIAKPWGWSLDARRRLLTAGTPSAALPSDLWLATHRRLSHRATAGEVLRLVGYDGVIPVVTSSASEAMQFIDTHGDCYVKSPWSGSGRGVFSTPGLTRRALADRLTGIIHRQGSVTVEKSLHKIIDFAALYVCSAGKVEFHGLSAFEVEPRGMYVGNVVAPPPEIRNIILRHTDEKSLSHATEAVRKALESLIAVDYSGPVGVDMMVCDTPAGPAIMPCIEVNLRMTMGFVAAAIAERLCITEPAFLHWHHGSNQPRDAIRLLPQVNDFTLVLQSNRFFNNEC